jgi:hypothetical protein
MAPSRDSLSESPRGARIAGVEKREPDTSGDYGYDLVHEAVGDDRREGQQNVPGDRGPAPGDQGGDYGYDEAHDFR